MPKPFERLGPVSLQLCHLYDAMVVGSSARTLAHNLNEPLTDVDIVVPIDRWTLACKLIPRNATANVYGGFRFLDGETEVDVWADDAARVVLSSPCAAKSPYIWSPRYSGSLCWEAHA